MLSREDLQRLLDRSPNENAVLSAYIDMSVTSDNKRTHQIFLNKERSAHAELDSDRGAHHREALGQAFERLERWLAEEYDEANKGVALFVEIGGDWIEGLQFPVPVQNRVELADRPVVGPLVELLEENRRHLLVMVDREHLRLVAVTLGVAVEESSYQSEQTDSPHDVQRGGYSQAGYQRKRAEEVRHGFKEFAEHVAALERRHQPHDVVLIGTEETVKAFEEFLPEPIQERVVWRTTGPMDTPTPLLLEKLRDFFEEQVRRSEAEVVSLLQERVRQSHFATSGFHDTLEQLQEGKVDTLVIARDAERTGAQCTKCGFYLPKHDPRCPYCGGQTRDSIDLVEVMIRMAADQDVAVEFVEPQAIEELNGVGALLRY